MSRSVELAIFLFFFLLQCECQSTKFPDQKKDNIFFLLFISANIAQRLEY